MAAQAEFQGAHGRQAGVAADHTGSPQQQHAHAGAQCDGQHCARQAQTGGQHGADLQHHQADAEGEPQREQVAGTEDALVGGIGWSGENWLGVVIVMFARRIDRVSPTH